MANKGGGTLAERYLFESLPDVEIPKEQSKSPKPKTLHYDLYNLEEE